MGISREKMETIYRYMEKEYLCQDAENHITVDYTEVADKFTAKMYDELVTLFQKRSDCNVAVNDTWDSVIQEYIKINNLEA